MSEPIPAPALSVPNHGLAKTAFLSPVDSLAGSRWEGGFAFNPETCVEPESWSIPCVGTATDNSGAGVTENRGTDQTALEWTPFVVRASFKCTAQQLTSNEYERRARVAFQAGFSKLVETELWRGDAAGWNRADGDVNFDGPNLTLAETGVTDLSAGGGGAAPPVALRALVQAAAQAPNGPQAMIHAKPATVAAWGQGGALVEDREGKLRTRVGGHYVVAGTGYTGEGPGLTAPPVNEGWAYVTTPVYLIKGDDVEVVRDPDRRTASTMNRADNDIELIVQQTVAYYWDGCLHAGIPVDEAGSSV